MDFDGSMKVSAEGIGQVHADPCGEALGVAHFKGGIGEIHPDEEFFFIGGVEATDSDEEAEKNSQIDIHGE